MKKSILETHPLLCLEWDYKKNGDLKPEHVSHGSNKNVWWLCKEDHSWKASINNRSSGKGCPYCLNKLPIIGKTDLATVNPRLVEEWDYEKNGDLKPEDVTAYSGKKVWWICEEKHSWKATIANRSYGKNCPYCSGKRPIVGKTDLRTQNPLIIEEWDYEKNKGFRPEDFSSYSNKVVWWICQNGHNWKAAISQRSSGIQCPYCSGNYPIIGKTDLATVNPRLAEEWDYEKNGDLKPEDVTACSGKKVWWICEEKHSWKTTIAKRTGGRNCPYCSNKRPIVGKTDFNYMYPKITKEWDYKKNGNLTPECVTSGSTAKKIWWICEENHSWQATVYQRTKGSRCPYCSGYRPIVGKTDFATVHPNLAKEWDYEKNGDLTPQDFTKCSGKMVWWRCKEKHSWNATIASRVRGNNCPYCSHRFPILGETDLATTHPELTKEWDYEKNGDLTPESVSCNSHKSVYWKCINNSNHIWKANIYNRTKGSNCPYCAGTTAIVGKTDLATVNPRLAKEWDYEKNKNLSPQQVTCGSNKKVWWKCLNGHSWRACINDRNKGNGCPFCLHRN